MPGRGNNRFNPTHRNGHRLLDLVWIPGSRSKIPRLSSNKKGGKVNPSCRIPALWPVDRRDVKNRRTLTRMSGLSRLWKLPCLRRRLSQFVKEPYLWSNRRVSLSVWEERVVPVIKNRRVFSTPVEQFYRVWVKIVCRLSMRLKGISKSWRGRINFWGNYKIRDRCSNSSNRKDRVSTVVEGFKRVFREETMAITKWDREKLKLQIVQDTISDHEEDKTSMMK